MKATVDRKEFAEAVRIVARAATTRTTTPILGHILITADLSYGLSLAATDLGISIRRLIPAKVKVEGAFTVPAKLFVDLMAVPNDADTVSLQLLKTGNILKMTIGRMISRIATLPAEDFPVLDVAEGEGVEFDVEELQDLISKTAMSVSKDEARVALTGVEFKFEPDELVMKSADGFRMSVVGAPLPKFSGDESPVPNVILPGKALTKLKGILGKRETVTMHMIKGSTGRVAFVSGDLQMSITRIEGDMPSLDGIIPTSHKARAVFPKKTGLLALKAASVFAEGHGNKVVLTLEEDGIKMSASENAGDSESVLPVDQIEGEQMSIAFNVKMLIDFLKIKNGGDMAILETEGPLKAAAFRYQGNDDFLHVVMPMHMPK